MIKRNINYLFIEFNEITDIMIEEFRKMWNIARKSHGDDDT